MSKLSSLINTVSEKTSALIWKANLLKSEPKDIHELRDHMTMKLRNSAWGLASVFAFTGFMGYTLGPVLACHTLADAVAPLRDPALAGLPSRVAALRR